MTQFSISSRGSLVDALTEAFDSAPGASPPAAPEGKIFEDIFLELSSIVKVQVESKVDWGLRVKGAATESLNLGGATPAQSFSKREDKDSRLPGEGLLNQENRTPLSVSESPEIYVQMSSESGDFLLRSVDLDKIRNIQRYEFYSYQFGFASGELDPFAFKVDQYSSELIDEIFSAEGESEVSRIEISANNFDLSSSQEHQFLGSFDIFDSIGYSRDEGLSDGVPVEEISEDHKLKHLGATEERSRPIPRIDFSDQDAEEARNQKSAVSGTSNLESLSFDRADSSRPIYSPPIPSIWVQLGTSGSLAEDPQDALHAGLEPQNRTPVLLNSQTQAALALIPVETPIPSSLRTVEEPAGWAGMFLDDAVVAQKLPEEARLSAEAPLMQQKNVSPSQTEAISRQEDQLSRAPQSVLIGSDVFSQETSGVTRAAESVSPSQFRPSFVGQRATVRVESALPSDEAHAIARRPPSAAQNKLTGSAIGAWSKPQPSQDSHSGAVHMRQPPVEVAGPSSVFWGTEALETPEETNHSEGKGRGTPRLSEWLEGALPRPHVAGSKAMWSEAITRIGRQPIDAGQGLYVPSPNEQRVELIHRPPSAVRLKAMVRLQEDSSESARLQETARNRIAAVGSEAFSIPKSKYIPKTWNYLARPDVALSEVTDVTTPPTEASGSEDPDGPTPAGQTGVVIQKAEPRQSAPLEKVETVLGYGRLPHRQEIAEGRDHNIPPTAYQRFDEGAQIAATTPKEPEVATGALQPEGKHRDIPMFGGAGGRQSQDTVTRSEGVDARRGARSDSRDLPRRSEAVPPAQRRFENAGVATAQPAAVFGTDSAPIEERSGHSGPEKKEASLEMPLPAAPSAGSPAQPVLKEASPIPRTTPPPAQQIAEAVSAAGEGRIDLRLEPEELGRVSFNVKHSEHGISLHITADRPETLDLLRRHADQLSRFLSDTGYQNSSFTFSGGRQDRPPVPNRHRGTAESHLPAQPPAAMVIQSAARGQADEGLDLRL